MIKGIMTGGKMRFLTFVAIFSASFSLLLWADDDHDKAKQLMESGDILPLETILMNLKSLSSGRVIEVELERNHGRLIYEIENVDENGVVREFVFDAVTGEQLKEKMDN